MNLEAPDYPVMVEHMFVTVNGRVVQVSGELTLCGSEHCQMNYTLTGGGSYVDDADRILPLDGQYIYVGGKIVVHKN